MANDISPIDQFMWFRLDWINKLILQLTPNAWALLCGLIVFLGVAGWRLGHFTMPEVPRISQFIRHSARLLLLWPSLLALVMVVVTWTSFFGLCYTLDLVPDGFRAQHSQIMAMAWGATAALVPSAMAFYWLIPGLELPGSSSADPGATLPTIENYDPERYYLV